MLIVPLGLISTTSTKPPIANVHDKNYVPPNCTNEVEVRIATRATIAFAIVAVLPLLAILLLRYFYPDLLLIDITPSPSP